MTGREETFDEIAERLLPDDPTHRPAVARALFHMMIRGGTQFAAFAQRTEGVPLLDALDGWTAVLSQTIAEGPDGSLSLVP